MASRFLYTQVRVSFRVGRLIGGLATLLLSVGLEYEGFFGNGS